MRIFNIETYGDFDMPHTAVLMVAPEGMSKKTAEMIAEEASDMFRNTNEVDGVIRYLESWGCTTVKQHKIQVGGNL